MKYTILFLLLPFAAGAQVYIDKSNKAPDIIVESKTDTVDCDYITEDGIFRGFEVVKTYIVKYAKHEPHTNLEFETITEVLDDKKQRVKKVLATRLIASYIKVHSGTLWQKFN